MTHLPATATATVATDRPGRYAKQLVSHMGRKTAAEWNTETETGQIIFGDAIAICKLQSTPGALALELSAVDEANLEKFAEIVAVHLVRFGEKDELECNWQR